LKGRFSKQIRRSTTVELQTLFGRPMAPGCPLDRVPAPEKRRFASSEPYRPSAGLGFAQRNAHFLFRTSTLRADVAHNARSAHRALLQEYHSVIENPVDERQYGHTQPEIKKPL